MARNTTTTTDPADRKLARRYGALWLCGWRLANALVAGASRTALRQQMHATLPPHLPLPEALDTPAVQVAAALLSLAEEAERRGNPDAADRLLAIAATVEGTS
jgi:hypothetical protein